MFKALAQRIARYVLRDELNNLQEQIEDMDYNVYVANDKLRKAMDEVKHDNASLVEIMHELRTEIDMLNGELSCLRDPNHDPYSPYSL
jgi:peptidoglycan hydrolase CwlO-like protein